MKNDLIILAQKIEKKYMPSQKENPPALYNLDKIRAKLEEIRQLTKQVESQYIRSFSEAGPISKHFPAINYHSTMLSLNSIVRELNSNIKGLEKTWVPFLKDL
jgi:hypothetical protein